jgi:glycosyltransferase involved in cell wall biosynthesis
MYVMSDRGSRLLSAIIPTLNEGENIAELVRRVESRLRARGMTFEIVVVHEVLG